MHDRAHIIAASGLVYLIAAPVMAQFTPTSQNRFVKVQSGSTIVLKTAPDFGPFNEEVIFGSSKAKVDSTISPHSIQASCNTSGSTSFPTCEATVTFSLAVPTTVRFQAGAGDGGGGSTATSSLSGGGGGVIFKIVSGQIPPSIDELVTLPPGTYVVSGTSILNAGTFYTLEAFPHTIDWYTIDGGGGTSTGGAITLSGTIGQFDAGKLSGGPFDLLGGFWGASGSPLCYPDCDASGTLNIDDFICFQTLFAIGDPLADCDGGGSLNIDDFICFQTFFALGC